MRGGVGSGYFSDARQETAQAACAGNPICCGVGCECFLAGNRIGSWNRKPPKTGAFLLGWRGHPTFEVSRNVGWGDLWCPTHRAKCARWMGHHLRWGQLPSATSATSGGANCLRPPAPPAVGPTAFGHLPSAGRAQGCGFPGLKIQTWGTHNSFQVSALS